MNITELDIKLLSYLHKFKVATYKQIQRDIYTKYQLNTVRERVFKLVKQKLVCGHQDRIFRRGEKVLSISKLGFEKFIKKNEELRVELKSDAIEHDLSLVDIHYQLKQCSQISEYFTENQLQTWGQPDVATDLSQLIKANSDAVARIAFPKGDAWALIEYDRTEKSRRHYDSVINKFYHNHDVHLILYVCKYERILNKIASREKALFVDERPKIFYQLLHELQQTEVIKFYNYQKHGLEFPKLKGEILPRDNCEISRI